MCPHHTWPLLHPDLSVLQVYSVSEHVSPPAGQQKDLRWSLAVIQVFSGEGLDTCVRVLQKLCSVLLQPWRVHGHMGPTPPRCLILSVCVNTLRLLRAMLTELLRGGAFQFRDTRVACVLVSLHMIVCSVPASGRLDGEESRVQALIVDVLLTFTQGVSEQVGGDTHTHTHTHTHTLTHTHTHTACLAGG